MIKAKSALAIMGDGQLSPLNHRKEGTLIRTYDLTKDKEPQQNLFFYLASHNIECTIWYTATRQVKKNSKKANPCK